MGTQEILRAEGHLFDALFSLSKRPTQADAYECLRDKRVSCAAIKLAEEMRRYAIEEDRERSRHKKTLLNYRRFYVASVGIGIVPAKRSERRFDWWAFPAHNTKSSPKVPKFCAEMRVMRAARESTCTCIGGIVVIGERQPDGRSGIIRPIGLDPCEACRDCMRSKENRHLFGKKTLVLTGQPLAQVHHLEPIPELMKAHGEPWGR